MKLVEVTRADIHSRSKGQADLSSTCPLARALTRALGQTIRVGSFNYYGIGFGRCLPKEAMEFRKRFDSDEDVEPFTFAIQEETGA